MRTARARLAVLALVVLAAACGGGRAGQEQAEPTEDVTTTEATTESTEATEEESATEDASETEEASETAAECGEPSTGITDDSIKIGAIYPLSGPASAYGAIPVGVKAFLDYANAELDGAPGAFEGRQFDYQMRDDGYVPAKSVEHARELIEQAQVFALLNTLGTPPNTAIWDYVNQQEVPHVFVATGASKFGTDVAGHPWTSGWQPNYVAESRIYAKYLADNLPDAKVAVLYQNDDYGLDYLNGFKAAIEGTGVTIVAEQSYETADATVDSQMTNLASSGADVFFNITTPKFAAQALAFDAANAWNPTHLLNSVSNSLSVLSQVGFDKVQNVVTALYVKDASDPEFADDEGVKLYLEKLAQYAPDADPSNSFHIYGWSVAQSFYKVLEATECPTRESLMETVRSLDNVEVDTLIDGVTMTTEGEEDGFPLEAMQVAIFEGESWARQGEVIDTREEFGPVTAEG